MKTKSALFPCLFSALATTLLAAAPQYTARKDIATGLGRLGGIAVADFNGDGKPDFAVLDSNSNLTNIVVYMNEGNGNFSDPILTALPIAENSMAFVAGDFNEDGKQDVIVSFIRSSGTNISILLVGNGDGTFVSQTLPVGNFNVMIAADINHDSHLDFIGGDDRNLTVALGDGRGSFTYQVLSPSLISGIRALLGADVNADSNPDLIFGVAASGSSTLQIYSGIGGGAFAGPAPISLTKLMSPLTLSAADFNGDGKLDLLVGTNPYAGVIFGNGDGTFQSGDSDIHYLNLPPRKIQGPAYTATADVNGDGKPDIIVADGSSETMDVFLNDGTGTFSQSAPDFTADIPIFSQQMQVADFNGDGLPDIAITSLQNNVVSLFFSVPPKATSTLTLMPSASTQFVGTSISFAVKVAGTTNGIPTGTVTLTEGANSLGQQTLDSHGEAVFSLSSLATGQHTLSANYSGDGTYAASVASIIQSVTDFQISPPTASQTVAAGKTAFYNVTVTPLAGLAGTLTVTCSQLPALTSCDPLTVPLNGQPVTATLNVHTTAPVQPKDTSVVKAAELGFVSIFLLALFPSRRRIYSRLTVGIIAIVLTSFSVGCSGGSSKSTGTITPGTPSGSTSFTITSTITQGGKTLAHTTAATLVVQ